MANHCTAEEEWGGEVVLHYWHLGAARRCLPFWGLFLEAREDIPKIIFEGGNKTTNPVVAKSYKKPKITSSWFISATPTLRTHRHRHRY